MDSPLLPSEKEAQLNVAEKAAADEAFIADKKPVSADEGEFPDEVLRWIEHRAAEYERQQSESSSA